MSSDSFRLANDPRYCMACCGLTDLTEINGVTHYRCPHCGITGGPLRPAEKTTAPATTLSKRKR